MQFRNSALIDIHQRIEPTNNPHDFKEHQVIRVFLAYVYQLMLHDAFMILFKNLIPKKNRFEKRECQRVICNNNSSKIFKIMHFTLFS